MINIKDLMRDLNEIRIVSPLVHNITNYVVMNNTANALLAIGASPVMAHAAEEMEEMASIASALVINIGTLSDPWIKGMLIAGKTAYKKGTPIIFDPVGAGATFYRTDTCHKIIEECHPSIIRGNASEIMALIKHDIKTKGVDSSEASDTAVEAAKELAVTTGAVVSISGATDYITDGTTVMAVTNGHEMMTKVTGLGCTASAITGAFAAVNRNYLMAATEAMVVMGITGEVAVIESEGPGSLQMNFIDELYNLDETTIIKHIK
ncbi:MAG: hydroxyethylthiazole kinase [Bacteroidales bacterium]|nr:hydroxyethylthiazole kinase [Bacteroidales bacterium]